eukprot:4923854-Prymnesium_polylepis.1
MLWMPSKRPRTLTTVLKMLYTVWWVTLLCEVVMVAHKPSPKCPDVQTSPDVPRRVCPDVPRRVPRRNQMCPDVVRVVQAQTL